MRSKASRNDHGPVVGMTMGDPAGVGPETIAQTLCQRGIQRLGTIHLIGDGAAGERYRDLLPANCAFTDLKQLSRKEVKPGRGSVRTAAASFTYLTKAVELLKAGEIQALVTGPVNKGLITESGVKFSGHTEFLAESFGVKQYEMLFVGPGLRTLVVTRHIPLSEVSRSLTTERLVAAFRLAAHSLKKHFHIRRPRLAVCGLNPHAGEGGTIGREELDIISPAIQLARRARIDLSGPFPADTLFTPDLMRQFDLIIAMYHDQGLVPVKASCFHELVNVTIGLPFVRTSPAHGTAFNIAGKAIARPDSMIAATRLAFQLLPQPSRRS